MGRKMRHSVPLETVIDAQLASVSVALATSTALVSLIASIGVSLLDLLAGRLRPLVADIGVGGAKRDNAGGDQDDVSAERRNQEADHVSASRILATIR